MYHYKLVIRTDASPDAKYGLLMIMYHYKLVIRISTILYILYNVIFLKKVLALFSES